VILSTRCFGWARIAMSQFEYSIASRPDRVSVWIDIARW
jgi:hypothetical protein